MSTPTLAEKLGTTAHVSGLLKKAGRLGLDAAGLERLAIQRGCDYYHEGDPLPAPSVTCEEFSDEELAIALLNPAFRYHPQTLRLGAAMLGAEGNSPVRLAQLAIQERSVVPARYVAEAGRKYEPENLFWTQLLEALPASAMPDPGVLPHPNRFVAMTGFTRKGPGLVVEWQRPQRRQLAAA